MYRIKPDSCQAQVEAAGILYLCIVTDLHLGCLSVSVVINSLQPDNSAAEWSRVFSVSVEEDLLTWVFPFCKPYLTSQQRRGGMEWGAAEKKRLGYC